MIPAHIVLSIYQGQTFDDIVTLTDDADVPLDLTSWGARMQIREYRGSPILLELTTANGRIVLDALGQITFNVAAADTSALLVQYDYEQWVFSCELFKTVGMEEVVQTPIFGVVVVYPEITI